MGRGQGGCVVRGGERVRCGGDGGGGVCVEDGVEGGLAKAWWYDGLGKVLLRISMSQMHALAKRNESCYAVAVYLLERRWLHLLCGSIVVVAPCR